MTAYRDPYPRITAERLLGRDGNPYLADDDLLAAANAALALGMPLLLTGEAGCGKTDFAFALAHAVCNGAIRDTYVRSDTTARDLLYEYDAIARFGDAQHGGDEGAARARDPRHYIRLNGLGHALVGGERTVVLIDEIDKAPRDLPNDLLRELDQHEFTINEIPPETVAGDVASPGATPAPLEADQSLTYRRTMKRMPGAEKPIIVITSNVERQLPDPFLRRCVFYHIRFPEERLLPILRTRFGGQTPFLEQAVDLFSELRSERLTKKPGTSELINWVQVLTDVYDPDWVGRELRVARDAVANRKTGERNEGWATLPGLACLVKLREDQHVLGIGA